MRPSPSAGLSAADVVVPRWDFGTVVVEPPSTKPGAWAGAPSAVFVDGTFYLAYRLRLPIGEGRGYANVVARSDDGERFETVAVVEREAFGSDSLERPALVAAPDGRWRLYVSIATPGTKHWRVDVLESATVEGLATASPRTVLPGSDAMAVKDPVVLRHDGQWHLWASCHPLDDPDHTDRMTTQYATSPDGLDWSWRGTALAGRSGAWDARGVRVTAVLADRRTPVAFYDGRASAAENYEERTGVAVSTGGFGYFAAVGDAPASSSPYAGGGLRYVSVAGDGRGGLRYYFEGTRADGAHDLRTHPVPSEAAVA
jgi:hypothetical protein